MAAGCCLVKHPLPEHSIIDVNWNGIPRKGILSYQGGDGNDVEIRFKATPKLGTTMRIWQPADARQPS